MPAAFLSGIPSTLHALATGNDPLAATHAAGSMVLPHEHRSGPLLVAAVPVHLAISSFWGIALAAVLPRDKPVIYGAVAGGAIAALDLGVFARRFPRVRALPTAPQIADHVAFGIVTALAIARIRRGQ